MPGEVDLLPSELSPGDEVRRRYSAALEALVEKLAQDPNVLAAVLIGSLSHDQVWEKSDIDLYVVTQELKLRRRSYSLLERGVTIHAYLMPRSEFRQKMEGGRQGDMVAHYRGKLLFSRDETLATLFDARDQVGQRDREALVLRQASWLIPCLTKAEKWLYAKDDLDYCFLWLLKCLEPLALIELARRGKTAGREAIHQARRHNPELFESLYSGLIHGDKSRSALTGALHRLRHYLLSDADELFALILEHLRQTDGVLATTELNHHFHSHLGTGDLDPVFEWLADEGIIQRAGTAVRLTDRSKVDLEEAAYYLAGD
jgi:predicted nucleotidyltransferase